MKKKFLLGVLCSLAILPFTVKAQDSTIIESVVDGSNSSNASVMVGEVETPVYEVEVIWNSFQFDWKYNSEKGEYGWESVDSRDVTKISESENFDEELFEIVRNAIYTDKTCKNPITNDITYEDVLADPENYYHCGGVADTDDFHIGDYSMAGKITPYVKWSSAEEYEYVDGKFMYMVPEEKCEVIGSEVEFESNMDYGIPMYSDSTCTEELSDDVTEYQNGIYAFNNNSKSVELTTERVPDDGRHSGLDGADWYHLRLHLENKNKPATFPKAGDTIGTITITIKNN